MNATLDIKDIKPARLRADHSVIFSRPRGEKPIHDGPMPALICAWENRQFQIVAITHHGLN